MGEGGNYWDIWRKSFVKYEVPGEKIPKDKAYLIC